MGATIPTILTRLSGSYYTIADTPDAGEIPVPNEAETAYELLDVKNANSLLRGELETAKVTALDDLRSVAGGVVAPFGVAYGAGYGSLGIEVTAARTLGNHEHTVVVDVTGASRTITMPVAPQDGQEHLILRSDASTNTCTLSGYFTDGTAVSSFTLEPYTAVRLKWYLEGGYWRVLQKSQVRSAESIGFAVDGAGEVVTTGTIRLRRVMPFTLILTRNTLIANESGSIVVDVKKSTYTNFPTTASITASAKPTLSNVQKSQDSTLTGWTTTLSKGDVIEAVIDSVTSVTGFTLTLEGYRL
jgi:hypothetical protein